MISAAMELDLDSRLADLWEDIADERLDLDIAAALARCAYARGYTDALTEPERGQLYRDHGMKIPERRAPT